MGEPGPDRAPGHLPEWDFQRTYGPWAPMHPTEVATLFAHAPFTWWVVGGWSLEADSRDPRRRHDDIDVAVLAAEVDAVREWLAGFHLWETHDGTLRPVRRGEDEEAQGWFGEALELAEPGHP